ncbi:MAG: Copper-exporting P-type ATPase A [Verrucomicrobia subdivision 3 bacterium]|nr:Copper-exporting P-type ATPase A [Limisphaerales bacterium]MCS1412885.1 Copper-exporting P-type ATPase A [Limisphaerales bacterium]
MIKFVKYLTAIALLASLTTVADEEKAAQCSSQKQLTLKIDGAACETVCAELDKALTSLDGVKAESCSKSHLTKVAYDASKVKLEQVLAAFKKAGVKLEGQQIELAVNGMACGACSSKVSKALTKLNGVLNGAACHQSKKAIVLFDPTKVKAEKIVAAINSTGFTVAEDVKAN